MADRREVAFATHHDEEITRLAALVGKLRAAGDAGPDMLGLAMRAGDRGVRHAKTPRCKSRDMSAATGARRACIVGAEGFRFG